MLTEIIEIYEKQIDYYKNIHQILNAINGESFDISEHIIELENVDFILNKIKELNEKSEQLKQIYVAKNKISDFTGDEIRKVEESAKYNDLKNIIDELTQEIITVKKLQDSIVKRIYDETDTTKKILSSIKPDKKGINEYKKNIEK